MDTVHGGAVGHPEGDRMSFIGRLRNRVRAAAARSRLERDMQEEMAAHIQQAAERLRARGMSDHDALLAARREFGNVGVLQEQARDARGARWIESVLGDLRHAIRQSARTPLLAATIVVTLTLGIGVSAAGFGVLAGMLTRPAPGVPSDPSLVAIRGLQRSAQSYGSRELSYPELMELGRLDEFSEVAGWTMTTVAAEFGGQELETAFAQFVTPNFFRVLHLTINPGRGFAQSRFDDRAPPEVTAVMSRLFAIEKFGSPDAAVGKTMKLNGAIVTIVGVAPPRFIGAGWHRETRTLWLPVSAWSIVDRRGGAFTTTGTGAFSAIGRLAEGTTIASATAAVEVVAARARNASPPSSGQRALTYSADVVPLRGNIRVEYGGGTPEIIGVTGLVVLILLVCTTTVSSLLVGAAMTRRREIAVRLALGASRARIIRQLLTESTVLAFVAGAAGLGVYALITRALRDSIARDNIEPTWTTALVTALFAMATALLCGLSPALHATRDDVAAALKDSSTAATVRSRLQRTFVVAQTALTQPLLVMLAMTIAIVLRETQARSRNLGEHVVRAEFDTWAAAGSGGDRLSAVVQRLSSLPGVRAVLPQVSGYMILKLAAPSSGVTPGRLFEVRTDQTPPRYFAAMDIPLVRGREFLDRDSAEAVTPIVIATDFAAQIFGAVDPVGKRMTTHRPGDGGRMGEVEVVGVVAAEHVGSSESGARLRIFTPLNGKLGVRAFGPDALLIRTETYAEPFIRTFQDIARAEAPLTPVRRMVTLSQIDREARSELIEAAGASAAGGLIALLLASIGLYAVVALSVSQRIREIGVRVSLGATQRQVVAMFFRSGLRVSLTGLAIGLPLSVAAIKILSSQVGIPRVNMPIIVGAVAVCVIVVASLASWIPARRAAGVDPLIALRDG